MINTDNVSDALRRLLGLYHAVTIDHVRAHPSGATSILLRISDWESLARLAACAANANVAFYVWPEFPETKESERSWADCVQFELRTESDPIGTEVPTIHFFCHHLASDLRERGILAIEESIHLLDELYSEYD